MYSNNNRPVFLDLTRIRFPVVALVSIGHRISGVMLFASLPVALYLFGLSLQSAEGYAKVSSLLSGVPFKLLLIPYIWFLSHHLFAGIRHLLLDMEIGVDREQARLSAKLAIGAALVMLVIA
ncbi:MAG TPA: succinate dehydrogenase, cytochrome b556 subunit, partial [Gammaproteobacteria bacterium]|nr:succinate dehydrogenase, cytochrome b556 subunit [Gammaproteobacteria bacterium]